MSVCGRSDAICTVKLSEDVFGEYTDEKGNKTVIKRFTWKNSNNVSVQVITYGGTITTLSIPDKNGNVDDIVTGFNSLDGYLSSLNRYFGASVGRYANRIGNGKFTLEGVEYALAQNNNGNSLHGGVKGFDKVIWNSHVNGNKLVLSYLSKDMEEGFPGDLLVFITFELTTSNELIIDYKATTTKTTIVNLTNHSYFNLVGHNTGPKGLYEHVVSINADHITELDDQSIPTGNILEVGRTIFDLRIPKVLGDIINKVPNAPGFDHNYCVNSNYVARVVHPPTGRVVEVRSSKPGVQFYTANFLPEKCIIKGKEGYYNRHGAFCLETQYYPDSINKEKFPSPILKPGETYHHTTTYKFLIEC